MTAATPRLGFIVKAGASYLSRRENRNPKVPDVWVWGFSFSQSAVHRFPSLLSAQRRLDASDHRVVRLVTRSGGGS